jgi:hypothetical protein
MKTTLNLLLVGIVAVFCCSIGNAQISYTNALNGTTLIYSNGFAGAAVNITNTPADYEAGILGGKSNTNWVDALGAVDTNALYANGTMGTGQGDAWLLPFVPQAGYVYTLNASVTFLGNPNTWVGAGFCNYFGVTNISGGNARFNTGGIDFAILTESSRNVQAFAGPGATIGYAGVNGIWTPATGLHTLTQILDTTGTKWLAVTFVDGVQANTNYIYATNPTIRGVGLSQNGGQVALAQNTFTWSALTLAATPVVITKQPVSANIAAGAAFTNTVVVAATAPFYQWYTNDVPIPGATNASLILNPATDANAGTNYYVVITNSLGGSVTSAPVSLAVFDAPAIFSAYPVTYTNLVLSGVTNNLLTLYGGTNVNGTNYSGSTPTFSVSVIGQAPLYYQWQTNGVSVGGATNAGFTFTNCPLNGPTNFTCVITNVDGVATNSWLVSYVPTPIAPFPGAILSNNPSGFWRLNEGPDDENGDNGVLSLDYASGNNGIYTNAVFGYAGYTNTDPTEASTRFNFAGAPSGAFAIQGLDFSNNTSATFSVQAWVQGPASQPTGAAIIAKGNNGNEQFALDVNGNKFRFLVRNAAGTASSVTAATSVAAIGLAGAWHFVVGVCDEANGSVSLYVDGLTVGNAAMTAGSGVLGSTKPVTIGTRGSSATVDNDLQFSGYLSDVAVYNHALTSGQVANLWIAAGFSLGFTFVPPLPPTNFVFLANGTTNATITLPATVFGPGPVGYYWTNVTAGGIVGSGLTNAFGNLNATLIIPNAPASLSGDQLELIVTNAASFTNWFTTLFAPPPPVTLDYSSPILYSNNFNGGLWSIGGMQLTAANSLVGGTNTTWVDALGTNNAGKLAANGVSANTVGDSWLLPFTPHAGYIYTVTASVTLAGNPGSWVGVGFAQTLATNLGPTAAFNAGGVNGYGWEILTSGTANLQAFQGPAGVGQCVNINAFYPVPPATYTNTVVLDTTGTNWTVTFYVNGVLGGSTNYASIPPISAVGITQNTLTVPGNIQWNYFSLSQVAPGGVPPYLLNPQPPTNVTLLADTSLSIPATAFGSAPFGYYWSNTNTTAILGSGTTNNMAPLGANLSVSDVPNSWNGNTLALIVTNAYGTNISLVSLTVTNSTIIPTNQPTITGFSIVSGTNVMISATNGQSSGTYYLLGSTNVATPLSQWLPLATNVIVTNGSSVNGFTFIGTNAVSVGNPQQFYMLSNTN